MGEQNTNKKFCAIASIEIGDDNSLEVQKLVTFHDGHSDCDRRYGWGFNYAPGSKRITICNIAKDKVDIKTKFTEIFQIFSVLDTCG